MSLFEVLVVLWCIDVLIRMLFDNLKLMFMYGVFVI